MDKEKWSSQIKTNTLESSKMGSSVELESLLGPMAIVSVEFSKMVKSVERVRLQSMESHIKARWLMVNLSVNDLIFHYTILILMWVYLFDIYVCEKWKMEWNAKNIQKLFNFFDIILLWCGVKLMRWWDEEWRGDIRGYEVIVMIIWGNWYDINDIMIIENNKKKSTKLSH